MKILEIYDMKFPDMPYLYNTDGELWFMGDLHCNQPQLNMYIDMDDIDVKTSTVMSIHPSDTTTNVFLVSVLLYDDLYYVNNIPLVQSKDFYCWVFNNRTLAINEAKRFIDNRLRTGRRYNFIKTCIHTISTNDSTFKYGKETLNSQNVDEYAMYRCDIYEGLDLIPVDTYWISYGLSLFREEDF